MNRVLPTLAAACMAFLPLRASAEITYISDGQMPDFPQIWMANQSVNAICEAATAADVMWYLDQHGYAGLVKAGGVPATPWRSDAQSLVFTLGKYIYGKDPANGAISNLGRGPRSHRSASTSNRRICTPVRKPKVLTDSSLITTRRVTRHTLTGPARLVQAP